MLSLNSLSKVVVWINCFIIGALLMAWLTPFSFRVGPRFFPRLALFCLVLCLILALVSFLSRKLGDRSFWRQEKLVRSFVLSLFTFLLSLIFIYVLVPPHTSLFDIFRVSIFFRSYPYSQFYKESVVPSPNVQKAAVLVCFESGWDEDPQSWIAVDRLLVLRQKLAILKSATPFCIVPHSANMLPEVGVKFTWSANGKYLSWQDSWPYKIREFKTGKVAIH